MKKQSRRRLLAALAGMTAVASPTIGPAAASEPVRSSSLERSFWLHASLGSTTQNGYWGWGYRETRAPTQAEIANAASVLTRQYHANRLYLMYHRELPLDAAKRVFRAWRRVTPAEVEIVPTLLLRMYDPKLQEVFALSQLAELTAFFKEKVNRHRIAVYDIHPNRDPGEGLGILCRSFPHGLIRVGLQPGEPIASPYVAAVEDTWSAFCHGLAHEDWRSPGFGAETLRNWIAERNRGSTSVSWDLIAVAWDYSVTQRGEYPGYDDADKNMPLPAGRNALAISEILALARPDRLQGFSADLFIVHINSLSPKHDGPDGSLYEVLKRGHRYRGYYSGPLDEISDLFASAALRGSR